MDEHSNLSLCVCNGERPMHQNLATFSKNKSSFLPFEKMTILLDCSCLLAHNPLVYEIAGRIGLLGIKRSFIKRGDLWQNGSHVL